jgi:hypothetical protein
MISFLHNVPNLRRLNVRLKSNPINGCEWEQVIRNYLPKLKVFQLTMNDKRPINENIQERADELINSFRSSFWIDEHQWFVQCSVYDNTIYLETLSEIFNHFETKFPDSWKSTCPYDDHEKFYTTIERIYNDTFFDQPIPSYIHVQNITYLHIKLPITDKFWSIISSLKQLKSLAVSSHDDSCQSQLQVLLDQAPNLRDLHIGQSRLLPLQTSLFKYTNASVRQLNLEQCHHQFNEEECMALTRSPLGIQCQVLSIQVKNRESIIILVQKMIHLQALHVECENERCHELTEHDDESDDENTTNRNKVIRWLKDHLSSTCIISKDPDSTDYIRIWIKD